jgi:hypothetical protein
VSRTSPVRQNRTKVYVCGDKKKRIEVRVFRLSLQYYVRLPSDVFTHSYAASFEWRCHPVYSNLVTVQFSLESLCSQRVKTCVSLSPLSLSLNGTGINLLVIRLTTLLAAHSGHAQSTVCAKPNCDLQKVLVTRGQATLKARTTADVCRRLTPRK